MTPTTIKLKTKAQDGGLTIYWWDRTNRIVNDQTAEQRVSAKYNYIKYDALNRIIESGQLINLTALTQNIARGKDPSVTYNAWFALSGTMDQVSKTYYDLSPLTAFNQFNLRNRITLETYQEVFPGGYDYGIYHNYDVHGYVNTLIRENNYAALPVGETTKTVSIKYNLIDQNINAINYQEGAADQYFSKIRLRFK